MVNKFETYNQSESENLGIKSDQSEADKEKSIDRREFLRKSLVVGFGAAAAFYFPININMTSLPNINQWLEQYEETDNPKIKQELIDKISVRLEQAGTDIISQIEGQIKQREGKLD